ncbi:MAG: hypothetical protein KKB79_01050 [Nanoarchaeota archaeon]|nr:hypothetical protein [Nanoarchaeota archaeon]
MKMDWKKEFTRDVLALGSWVFYVLVIGRAMIEPYRPFLDQVIIAGIFIIAVSIFLKNFDDYIARGFVLVVFTSLFYESLVYSVFAVAVGLLLIFSSYFVRKNILSIIKGLLIGLMVILVGYFLPDFYM